MGGRLLPSAGIVTANGKPYAQLASPMHQHDTRWMHRPAMD